MKRNSVTIICVLTCLLGTLLSTSATLAQDDDQRTLQEIFNEAQTASQNEDFQKAVELLRDLQKKAPDNPDIPFFLGYNLHATGELDEAIVYHKKALTSDRYRPTALYNLACAYSLKQDKDQAFDYLKQAIVAGFRDTNHIGSDPDMKNIKDDPRFQTMMVLIENDGKEPVKLTAKDFYGEWKIISGMRAGSKFDAEALPTVKITKKTFTIPSAGGEFVMSYKLDLDAKPITVDFKIESGPVPEGQAKGIIKIKDKEMTLCYHPEGEQRPEKFLSSEQNGFFIFKMKKLDPQADSGEKKDGIASKVLGKWKCIKGVRAGEEIDQQRMESTITFDEKRIVIPVGGEEAFEMSYQIDADEDPVTIDMKIEAGPGPVGSPAVGIIKMEDDKFHLCYDPTGANHRRVSSQPQTTETSIS